MTDGSGGTERKPAVVVEVLDRRGRIARCERIERLPLRIGRAYGCDLILSDPSVDAEHALLTEAPPADGEEGEAPKAWVLEDLGSVNGLRIGRETLASARLGSGDSAHLGRVRLRFLRVDHAVPAAIAVEPSWLREGPLRHVPVAGACVALLLAWSLLQGFLQSHEEVTLYELAAEPLSGLLALAAWAGAWAFANRSLAGETRFWSHAALASLALLAIDASELVGGYASFLWLPSSFTSEATGFVRSAIVLSGLLYAHVALLSVAPPRRRAATVAITATAILAISQYSSWTADDDYSGALDFDPTLKPIVTRWVATESPDEFFGSLDALRERVDAEAREARDESAG